MSKTADLSIRMDWVREFIAFEKSIGKRYFLSVSRADKNAQKLLCFKIYNEGSDLLRVTKELHLFMPVGDDEIQVDSYDRKVNKQIMKLQKEEPEAVVMIYDEDAPAFLRAAVKVENVSITFRKTAVKKEITEAQRKARSTNGQKNKSNLLNNTEVKNELKN